MKALPAAIITAPNTSAKPGGSKDIAKPYLFIRIKIMQKSSTYGTKSHKNLARNALWICKDKKKQRADITAIAKKITKVINTISIGSLFRYEYMIS